jgi:hypothetical protein
MIDISLTQVEADALIAMDKYCADTTNWTYPSPGGRLKVHLVSQDRREKFTLHVTRAQVKLTKVSYQTQTHQTVTAQ